MTQTTQPSNPVATLQGLFPHYQAPVSPVQAASQGFQASNNLMPQTRFMPPGHARPGMSGFVGAQAPNALSAENLPSILQMLGRR